MSIGYASFMLKNRYQIFTENQSLFKMKIVEAFQKKSHFLMWIPLDTLERGLEVHS